MTPRRRQRLIFIAIIACVVAVAVGLALYAMRQNINLYYTPSQVHNGAVPKGRLFRIGGLVVAGSFKQQGMQSNFVISDMQQQVQVRYTGLLPDLFREGQGVVAQGQLDENNVFMAREVLAKHDEKYMPPT